MDKWLKKKKTTIQCITQLVSLILIRWMVIHRHPALQQLGTGGECVSWTKDLRNYQMCSSEKKNLRRATEFPRGGGEGGVGGGPKRRNFRGFGGWLLEAFFRGL